VYVDANTIIYRVERVQPYLAVTKPLWDALDAGAQAIVTSEITLLEVLVKPLRLGDTLLQSLFIGTLYGTPHFSSLPINRLILEIAAQLRASTHLKTPDAIHAATALEAGCTLFVTNDPAFKRVPDLAVVVLSDLTD
jgi:predicted nucleic acid-binding protein